MKKIQFLALLGSMIGFSSCVSIQPASQSTSYEFDEAYWQPGEHFGEPQDLSAQDLKSENEDLKSENEELTSENEKLKKQLAEFKQKIIGLNFVLKIMGHPQPDMED